MCRLVYPYENIKTIEDISLQEDFCASVVAAEGSDGVLIEASLKVGDFQESVSHKLSKSEAENKESFEIALAWPLFELLCKASGYAPPWGMLTGVRPAKLLRMLLENNSEEFVKERFIKDYRCSKEKYNLCRETLKYEEPILELSQKNSFSLYIGIPFCPTRCSYCSFVSQSVEKAGKLIPQYCDLLVKEIEATAQAANRCGLRLETVYMGGGTPTTLSAEQLDRILSSVYQHFDTSHLREFTVEAGRPDTITKEKLEAIKKNKVGRISINPQTLSDEVLRNIGRKHTAEQVYKSMHLAREVGFDCINMDLIAGLSGDTPESFAATLDGVLSLSPENITVHTLSVKRASNIMTGQEFKPDIHSLMPSNMLEQCSERLPANGYHPYYLYRQTRMLGNLENVGWALDGFDGLYNVYIMDETHTILACGAGAVTKLRQYGVNNIERIYNYKFPYEYISDFETILARKRKVDEFYDKFG